MWFLRFPKVFVENLLRKAMLKSLSFKMSLSNGIVVLCYKENEPTSWFQEFVLLKFGDVFFKVAFVSWCVKSKASGHRQISFFFYTTLNLLNKFHEGKTNTFHFFSFFEIIFHLIFFDIITWSDMSQITMSAHGITLWPYIQWKQ